jgi:hypothetical protein
MEESLRFFIILQQRHCVRQRNLSLSISSPHGGFILFFHYPAAAPLRLKKEPPLFVFRLLINVSLSFFITLRQRHRVRKRNLPLSIFRLVMEESFCFYSTLQQCHCVRQRAPLFFFLSPYGGVTPFVNVLQQRHCARKRNLPLSIFRHVMEESFCFFFITLQKRQCVRNRNLPCSSLASLWRSHSLC